MHNFCESLCLNDFAVLHLLLIIVLLRTLIACFLPPINIKRLQRCTKPISPRVLVNGKARSAYYDHIVSVRQTVRMVQICVGSFVQAESDLEILNVSFMGASNWHESRTDLEPKTCFRAKISPSFDFLAFPAPIPARAARDDTPPPRTAIPN